MQCKQHADWRAADWNLYARVFMQKKVFFSFVSRSRCYCRVSMQGASFIWSTPDNWFSAAFCQSHCRAVQVSCALLSAHRMDEEIWLFCSRAGVRWMIWVKKKKKAQSQTEQKRNLASSPKYLLCSKTLSVWKWWAASSSKETSARREHLHLDQKYQGEGGHLLKVNVFGEIDSLWNCRCFF